MTSPQPAEPPTIDIVIPLFERLTALDAIGPYETLQRLPGATVTFVADRPGEIRTDNGFLGLTADATYADKPAPDVVVVPGGVRRFARASSSRPRRRCCCEDDAVLMIEYDPQPPFDAGSVDGVGDEVMERLLVYAQDKN